MGNLFQKALEEISVRVEKIDPLYDLDERKLKSVFNFLFREKMTERNKQLFYLFSLCWEQELDNDFLYDQITQNSCPVSQERMIQLLERVSILSVLERSRRKNSISFFLSQEQCKNVQETAQYYEKSPGNFVEKNLFSGEIFKEIAFDTESHRYREPMEQFREVQEKKGEEL